MIESDDWTIFEISLRRITFGSFWSAPDRIEIDSLFSSINLPEYTTSSSVRTEYDTNFGSILSDGARIFWRMPPLSFFHRVAKSVSEGPILRPAVPMGFDGMRAIGQRNPKPCCNRRVHWNELGIVQLVIQDI